MAVEGDLLAQMRLAYAKIAAILQAAGLSLRHVVRAVEYVSVEGLTDYPPTADLRRELFEAHPPVTSPVVVKRPIQPTALIEIEVIASREGRILVDAAPAMDAVQGPLACQVGDVVYLAAEFPYPAGDNEIAAPGDIVGQARQIYENAGRLLQAAGLGWEHVVKTVEFLTPAGLDRYRETGSVRREYLGPRFPAATGIIMPRLLHPDALLQIDFVASRQPKELINPGWSRYDRVTYVPGVKAGNLLCLSGQGAVNPETGAVGHVGDIVGQTRYIYSTLMQVLQAAGVGPEAVVKTIDFVTPAALPRYRETAHVRREFFQPPYPAATGVVCESLLRPEMLIEVDAWAVLA